MASVLENFMTDGTRQFGSVGNGRKSVLRHPDKLSRIVLVFFVPSKVRWFRTLAHLRADVWLARWRRAALQAPALRLLLAAALMGFCLFAGGSMLLENRSIPTLDERPADASSLAPHGRLSRNSGQPQQNQSAERLTIGLRLHQQHPDVPLVFSGFSGKLLYRGWSEADIIQRILSDLNVSAARILFEQTSRNTYENAVNSRQMLLPQPGSRWILVTSASHMPRSMGSFEAAGWTGVIPIQSITPQEQISGGFTVFDLALTQCGKRFMKLPDW